MIYSKHSGYSRSGIRLYPGGGGKGGGGGGSAPAPDPVLIAAQIRSMGIQDEAIKAVMSNSNEMLPLQKEQTQFGLESSKTAYEQSQDDRGWALARRGEMTGVQDGMIKDAADFNADGRQEQLAQKAGEDVAGAVKASEGQLTRTMASRGINANSGAALSAMSGSALTGAMAGASAVNNTREAARKEGYGLSDRANSALAGYSTQASAATGAGAGFGTAGLATANAGAAGMNAGFGAAGGMAGQMGSNATGMFGAQGSYKNTQDQISNQPDPMMQLMGGAAMKYAMSDVNQKESICATEPGSALEAVKALPVSEWQYKEDSPAHDGGKRHTGPMAQDVQRVVGEKAAPGGKMIDLISLNGLNMAATKDLNQKVDQLTQQVKRLSVGGVHRKESNV